MRTYELSGLVSGGVSLHMRGASPEGEHSRGPCVLLFTGDGSFGSKGRSFAPLMAALANAGVHAIIVDYAGFGFSEGSLENFRISTALQNGHDALDFVRSQPFVDPDNIGIYAPSFGALIALGLGSSDNPPQAIVLRAPAHDLKGSYVAEYGATKVADWIAGKIPTLNYLPSGYIQEAEKYSLITMAHAVQCPTLILQGCEDNIVTPRGSSQLAAALKDAYIKLLPGVGHSFKEEGALETLTEMTVEWFARYLRCGSY